MTETPCFKVFLDFYIAGKIKRRIQDAVWIVYLCGVLTVKILIRHTRVNTLGLYPSPVPQVGMHRTKTYINQYSRIYKNKSTYNLDIQISKVSKSH